MYFIGLDVHKKTISYCVKDAAGQVHREGKMGSTRCELDCWIKTLPQPRTIAMEATIFTCWIYDHLLPHAEKVKVAHPLMLRAIAAAKKKNDKIDAGKIADCLRCDFLPECHMVSTEIRDRRRILRYRHLLVRQMVQMKNRVSGLLMETGVEHNKQRLHKVGYFHELLSTNQEVHPCIRPLLKISRETIERCQKTEYALISSLQRDPMLAERIKRLRTIPGVGPITALTWALEIGDVSRFRTIKQAISYCGLCGEEKSSADKMMRTPLSKQRNKHIQHVLVEAAKLAPRQCYELALVHEKEMPLPAVLDYYSELSDFHSISRGRRPHSTYMDVGKQEVIHFIRSVESPVDQRLGFSRGRLATNQPLFPRGFQLPVPLGVDRLLPPRQHVLRRDVANGAVQADVVILDVPLHQTPRIFQRQRRSRPDAFPFERWQSVRAQGLPIRIHHRYLCLPRKQDATS